MKKKLIEAVPYIPLQKKKRKKDIEYIAVVALADIGNESHIILDVYRNNNKTLDIPVVRYAATKKDWGVYFPESGSWSGMGIENDYGVVCWDKNKGYYADETEHVLGSAEDLERIKLFFEHTSEVCGRSWWSYFSDNERHIRFAKKKKASELRAKRLQYRQENTPPLAEQDILKWADRRLFREKHYLFYRKKGRRASVCCSECGGVKTGAWQVGISYKSQFENKVDEPVNGCIGKCPLCGADGEYKPQGKAKYLKTMEKYVYFADKYFDGIVLRYIQVAKRHILEEMVGEDGLEMTGAYEVLEGVEIARSYFIQGKAVQTDFHKHNPYDGKDFWDDCNLYGLNNIRIGSAAVHPATYEALQGTFLQYSALKEYAQAKREINAKDYLERYIHFPQMEMLVKSKMFGIVDEMMLCYCGIIENEDAGSPDGFLGIRRDKIKMLTKNQGNTEILEMLKIEKQMQQNWTEQQVMQLTEIRAQRNDLDIALNVLTIQKLLNLIAKYAGCEYGTGCSGAVSRLQNTARTYFDYLQMRVSRGYDLSNTVYQRPRNLMEAHNRMVMETETEKQEKRLKEVSEKYPDIRKRYRKLRNMYFYEDDEFLIRPARSAEEIVMEGRILHHCVGGDGYLKKHNDGYSIILMLRRRQEADVPYITVGVRDKVIIQWYGAHDNKPDEENMQRWLDNYITRLKCKPEAAGKTAAQHEEVRLLAYA